MLNDKVRSLGERELEEVVGGHFMWVGLGMPDFPVPTPIAPPRRPRIPPVTPPTVSFPIPWPRWRFF